MSRIETARDADHNLREKLILGHFCYVLTPRQMGKSSLMVQTAFDPSKLTCPAGFDPKTAASTLYEGKRYYFCSTEDRGKFLTDPKMSLSMMPPKQ